MENLTVQYHPSTSDITHAISSDPQEIIEFNIFYHTTKIIAKAKDIYSGLLCNT